MHPEIDNPARAISLKVSSVFLFVIMASLIKSASDEVPPGEAVFFRSLFAIPVIVAWLASRGELSTGFRTISVRAHVFRGLIGTSAMALSFAGLAILPLYEVKAIQYASPLFVVVLAALMLGEKVRKVRLTAVFLGLIGVLIVLWPRLTAFTDGSADEKLAFGALVVLSGSLCAAFAQIHVRRMVETEQTAAIVFWFSLTATMLALLTLPFGWAMPSPRAAAMLIGAGLIGGVGQILLTSAYRFADTGVIVPFEYASMLFAVGIGYTVFSEVPTAQQMVGAAVVIAAGVLIILRERQLKLQRGKARQIVTKYG